ncbi:DUF1810 domain-containing protein [Kineococcus sp. GCM10028916]|uniref:DUF1810 domain-containing protein n=1 Tax=Kineococcus sp. GCM10028916 TaxID=3273394 RepID=UPI00363A411E
MDLERFVAASDATHDRALAELRAGRKTSHWMWWEFPQLLLGSSPTSVEFALSGREEARAYLAHPVLGARLRENCQVLLDGAADDARAVFGAVDEVKLRSSLTLFAACSDEDLFDRVLTKFFGGETDPATERLLGSAG